MWYLKRKKLNEADNIVEHIIYLNNYEKEYKFGRSNDIEFSCPNVYVSREHCVFSFRENDKYHPQVIDKGTLNGTFVNGIKIPAQENFTLKDGDIIGLGVNITLSNFGEGGYVYELNCSEKALLARRIKKRKNSEIENCNAKVPKLDENGDVNSLQIVSSRGKPEEVIMNIKQEPIDILKIKQEPNEVKIKEEPGEKQEAKNNPESKDPKSILNNTEDSDIIVLDDEEDKLNYSTIEDDIIVISDEEMDYNFPNSQIFDFKVEIKEEPQDEGLSVLQGDDDDDDDDYSVICEEEDERLQRWLNILSQEKKVPKKEENIDFEDKMEALLKTIDIDEELDFKRNESTPIGFTEEKTEKISNFEDVVRENEEVTDKNQTSPTSTTSTSSLINQSEEKKESKSKGKEGIKLISPLPLVPHKKIPKTKEEKPPKQVSLKIKKNEKVSKKKIIQNKKLKNAVKNLDSETKLEIKNNRKEKLKQLALNKQDDSKKNENHKLQTSEIKVKNTKKSRGDILTEELLSKPGPSGENQVDKSSKSTTKKTKEKVKESQKKLSPPPTINKKITLPPIPKKAQKINILEGDKIVPLDEPTTSYKSSKEGKSVRFKEAVIREYIIEDGCELKPTTNAQIVEKKAPIIKNKMVIAEKSKSNKTQSSLELIADVVGWKVSWLQEATKNPNPPPVVDLKSLCPTVTRYFDFKDYKKVYIPLMYLEMWSSIHNDFLNVQRPPAICVINSYELNNVKLSKGKHLINVTCTMALSQKDVTHSFYPKVGDLVIIEMKHSKIDENSQSQIKAYTNIFGYVAHINLTKTNIHTDPQLFEIFKSHLKGPNIAFDYVLNFKILMKYRNMNFVVGSFIRLKVISHLRGHIKTMKAIQNFEFSPLFRNISNPHIKDFQLEKSKLEYYSQNEVNQNLTQKYTILNVTHNYLTFTRPKISIIQGPPGSGKTTMIMHMILQFLHELKKRSDGKSNKILLCAPSNAAIDVIVYRLINLNKKRPENERFSIVRVGVQNSIHPSVQEVSIKNLANAALAKQRDESCFNTEINTLESKLESLTISKEQIELTDRVQITSLEHKINECKTKIEMIRLKKEASRTEGLNDSDSCSDGCQIEIKIGKRKNSVFSNLPQKTVKWKRCFSFDYDLRRTEDTIETSTHSMLNAPYVSQAQNYEQQHIILQKADVVASTLSSCSTSLMENCFLSKEKGHSHFACCIIDEATQSTEPETLIPLVFGIDKLVLIGDQEQLPATILSQQAKKYNFQKSLFSRLQEIFANECVNSSPLILLNEQYRMHPEILKFPNQFFYQNRLFTSQMISNSRDSILYPYRIFDLDHLQKDDSDFSNPEEAKFVSNLTYTIYEKVKINNYKIGIITPYQKQKFTILKTLNPTIKNSIWVNTIDSFQGQEKDIVIFSIGRSQGVGFLADYQRLNVALTRAKYSLIICGNFSSLQHHHLWKTLLEDARERNCYFSIEANSKENINNKLFK